MKCRTCSVSHVSYVCVCVCVWCGAECGSPADKGPGRMGFNVIMHKDTRPETADVRLMDHS